MKLPLAAKAIGGAAAVLALTVAGTATASAATSSAASVSTSATSLPTVITDVITDLNLPMQVSGGQEAVTGTAYLIDYVRALADSMSIPNVVAYTDHDESGNAILIFTGDDDASTATSAFQVTGNPPFLSVANNTDEPWYIFSSASSWLADNVIPAGTAENTGDVGNVLSSTGFSFLGLSPSVFSLTGLTGS